MYFKRKRAWNKRDIVGSNGRVKREIKDKRRKKSKHTVAEAYTPLEKERVRVR